MADATTRLRLRVAPGAARSAIVGRHGDAWKLRVRSAPEGGRANADVLSLLAETLDVPARSLTLVAGHASRDKVVELRGLDADEAEQRLAGAR
jgi:uncharacterized protein